MKNITLIKELPHYINSSGRRYRKALYKCYCGVEFECLVQDVNSGHTKSCGCFRRQRKETHKLARHPLYRVWLGIAERCLNPESKDFMFYGARGIELCSEWQSDEGLKAFIDYVENNLGSRVKGVTIERVDNNKGYEPGNIRWASRKEQARNRRSNRFIEFNGQRRTLSEWSEITGIHKNTIRGRLNRGWPADKALSK